MRTHSATAGKLRCAIASLLVVAAVAASASPAGAKEASPSQTPQITPANAARLLPPGYVKLGNDYIYDGGAVVVTPAWSTESPGCPAGWLCLYRDSGFHGTRWQFHDSYWQNLRTYGASDEVSSFKNRCPERGSLGWDSIEQGKAPYLHLPAHARSSYIGDHWNDEASSVKPYSLN